MENNYFDFLKINGRSVSKSNPETNEVALLFNDALIALEILKKNNIEILGGDILLENNGKLIYAYQLWGDKYQYLNWYCDQRDDERKEHYLERCYNTAKENMISAHDISEKFKNKCYILFVV